MKTKPLAGEAIRFALVGMLATVLHYGIYYVLQKMMDAGVAYSIGYAVSFLMNFLLTARFTFGARPTWQRLAGMGGAHGVNYLVHISLLSLFLWAGMPRSWAPLPVFAIAIPVNFLLVRFVFKYNKIS